MTEPEQQILQRASAGDAAAIEHLLVRYLPELVQFLDRRAPPWLRGRESSSDLAQSVCREVLVHLRDGRLEFQGEPQFREWLYRAAVIKLMRRARHLGTDKRDPAREQAAPSAGSAGGGQVAAHGASPSEAAMLHEELERFRAAFESLSERDQEIVSLRLIDDASHRKIAERLGVSEAHSRVLLSRALAQLAQLGVQA